MGKRILLLLFLLSAGLILPVQKTIDLKKKQIGKVDERAFFLPGYLIKIGSLEFKDVVADLFWLQAVQLVGEKRFSKQDHGRLYRLIDRVTDLSPRFSYAYELGGVLFSLGTERIDLSNAILLKGTQYDPDKWQPWFYLGFNYFYYLNDPLKGAYYLAEATKKRRSPPPYLPLLTARLYSKANRSKTAILFLKTIYLSTKDTGMRKQIAEKIIEMEKEIATQKSQ
jgi:hypothetical protein